MFFIGFFSTATPHVLLIVGYILCFLFLSNPPQHNNQSLIEKEHAVKVTTVQKVISSTNHNNHCKANDYYASYYFSPLVHQFWQIPKKQVFWYTIAHTVKPLSLRFVKDSFIDLPPPQNLG